MREAALRLGAGTYLDAEEASAGKSLRRMGGAQLVIATASATAALEDAINGLALHGRLTVVGFDATPLSLDLDKLVAHARSVTGHLTGSPVEIEAAMRFAVAHDARPLVQTKPLNQAAEALAQQAGRARFRMVLTADD